MVAPASLHCNTAVMPRPYEHPPLTGVRLTPATPVIVAVQLAHTLIPTIVAHTCACAWPHAVAPQQFTLYPTVTPMLKETPAIVNVLVHVRNGLLQDRKSTRLNSSH